MCQLLPLYRSRRAERTALKLFINLSNVGISLMDHNFIIEFLFYLIFPKYFVDYRH